MASMSRQASPADASRRQFQPASTPAPSQNAAAYESPDTPVSDVTTPPSPSDRKRRHAARLARELASSGSWSDAVTPKTYGTMTPPPTSTHTSATRRQEAENTHQLASQSEQDLDPPPAYSRSAQVNDLDHIHELPAEAVHVPQPTATVTLPQMTDPHTYPTARADHVEQAQRVQEIEPDVNTPLLAHSSAHGPCRGRSIWAHRRKGRRRGCRCCSFLCAVITCSIMTSILVCLLLNHNIIRSFPPRHAKSTQPFIPTAPDYERHESTQDINGAYKLYDRIELTTSTGSIDIEIDPQPADHPAILVLRTDLGGITLRLSPNYHRQRHKVQRTIYTEITSFTGSIAAEILLGHGGFALVDTTTGVQTLSVLTYGVGSDDLISNLTTLSNTGTQRVVLTSLDSTSVPMSNVQGMHRSFGTSDLDIVYPTLWTGQVHVVASPFNRAQAVGNNLVYKTTRQDSILAYRGSGQNLTLVEVVSEGTGSASFKC